MLRLRIIHHVWTGIRWISLASIGIALTVLTACTVGPDYVRPTAEVPVSYKETVGWKVAEPKDHLIRGAWWEIYNDPELNALEEQVNLSNQNIAQAEAQFRQARALVQVARAAYFPTVTTSPALCAIPQILQRWRVDRHQYNRHLFETSHQNIDGQHNDKPYF